MITSFTWQITNRFFSRIQKEHSSVLLVPRTRILELITYSIFWQRPFIRIVLCSISWLNSDGFPHQIFIMEIYHTLDLPKDYFGNSLSKSRCLFTQTCYIGRHIINFENDTISDRSKTVLNKVVLLVSSDHEPSIIPFYLFFFIMLPA